MQLIHHLSLQYDTLYPSIRDIAEGATFAAKRTWEVFFDGFICGRPTWLSRKIDNLTRKLLPPATAKVASIFIQALPHLILAVTLPFYAHFTLTFVQIIVRAFRDYVDPIDMEDHLDHGLIGQTSANVISSSLELAESIIAKDPTRILFVSANLVLSGVTFFQLGIIKKIHDSAKELLKPQINEKMR